MGSGNTDVSHSRSLGLVGCYVVKPQFIGRSGIRLRHYQKKVSEAR